MNEVPKMEEYFDLTMFGNTETGEEPDDETDYYYTRERYWYHPNYLGNVDMITNDDGKIHQYFVYSPFGENMYQYNRNSEFNSRYRFNGKELDPETGNQYYGARYYDPKISVWLSVDPLAHKYRSLSSHVFVANNPISFVDPDGKRIRPVDEVSDKALQSLLSGFTSKYKKLFGLQIATVERQGQRKLNYYYSTAEYKSDNSFLWAARRAGLNKNERKAALNIYNKLKDAEIAELLVLTVDNSETQETNESSKVGRAKRYVQNKTVNGDFYKLLGDILKNNNSFDPTIANNLFIRGTYKEDAKGQSNNCVYFKDNFESNPGNVDGQTNGVAGILIVPNSTKQEIVNQAIQDAFGIFEL